jgi:hypothetical protein
MKKVKEKITELKNIYTGEIVCTSNLYEKRVDSTMTFIQVYKPEEPQRKYLIGCIDCQTLLYCVNKT